MKPSPDTDRIIVIGAGLAGLVCAGNLLAAGRRVLVLEAEDTVGGRVRTAITDDGFRLDRGFQVLFAAYPALRRHVPLATLQPRYFGSGIELVIDGRTTVLGHPIFDPKSIPGALRAHMVPLSDVATLAGYTVASLHLGDRPLPSSDISTRRDLARMGVSDQLIDRVLAPLFGGISLDRSLSSDSSFWRFVLRCIVTGRVFLPAFGVGQLTQVLASRLPASAIHCGKRVSELVVERNRVTGVIAGSESWRADTVVVATEAPVAQKLSNVHLPEGHRSCTTAYFVSDAPVSDSKRLLLNAEPSIVNHVVQLTNISPQYAPRGRHLLSATALDVISGDDSTAGQAMLNDMKIWLPGVERVDPRPRAVVRIPYAQFAQEPGIYGRLPGAATGVAGLYLAGEFLHSSSVQGAMRGGELAAEAILGSPTSLN